MSENENNENKDDFVMKFLIFVTILFILVFAYKYVLPALHAGDHRPSTFIEDINSGGYTNDLFNSF